MSLFRHLLCSTLCALGCSAQSIAWNAIGIDNIILNGGDPCPVGDIDGDGYADFVSGAGVWNANTQWIDPYWVWSSGKDGTRLRMQPLNASPFITADPIAPYGDSDRDGFPDWCALTFDWIATARSSAIEVRSGKTGNELWKINSPTDWERLGFGKILCADLDLNGDGKPDLLVGAYAARVNGYYGSVYAFLNGGQSYYRIDSSATFAFNMPGKPHAIAKLGDLDRDGCDDFVVRGGIPGQNPDGLLLISGKTGTLIRHVANPQPGDVFGDVLTACGDVDGDGTPDFAAANDTAFVPNAVAIFSGKTGAVIHIWRAQTMGAGFGASVMRGGVDVDQDGVPDLIVGCEWMISGGALFVFSGRDGSTLFEYRAGPMSGYENRKFGRHVLVLGQQPGSRYPWFLAVDIEYYSRPTTNRLYALGQILAFRGSPQGVQEYGLSCAPRLSKLPRIGLSSLSNGVRVTVHDAAPNEYAVLLLGTSRVQANGFSLPFPLDAIGLPGCQLYTSAQWSAPVLTGSVGNAAGYGALDLQCTLGLGPASMPVYAQWLCFTSGLQPGGASDAVSWSIR